MTNRFNARVRDKLGYYVYLYVDPTNDEVFYIGKGKGNRVFSHLEDAAGTEKVRRIKQIRKLGLEPRLEILKYGLSEAQALLVEATAIDLLDIRKLANLSRGHGSKHGSRATVEAIGAILDPRRVEIREPAILINVRRGFRHSMTAQELYDQTRSAWKVGPKRERATLALSVYHGIVREVYVITGWVKGGSTMRSTDANGHHASIPGRWEFVGKVASERVRSQHVGRSVAHYWRKGAQNPVQYVNC